MYMYMYICIYYTHIYIHTYIHISLLRSVWTADRPLQRAYRFLDTPAPSLKPSSLPTSAPESAAHWHSGGRRSAGSVSQPARPAADGEAASTTATAEPSSPKRENSGEAEGPKRENSAEADALSRRKSSALSFDKVTKWFQ